MKKEEGKQEVAQVVNSNVKSPRIITATGEIKSVDNRNVDGKDIVFITMFVTDCEDERIRKERQLSFIAGKKQLDNFASNDESYAKLVKQGSLVNVSVEERVEGVTQYTDDNGDVHTHGSSGLALSRALPLSSLETSEIALRRKLTIEREVARNSMTADMQSKKAALLAVGIDPELIPELLVR
jgi:hypothetical protein